MVGVEVDMDYFRDQGAHAILEVLPNLFTSGLTDPKRIYVLRWIAGRQAGVPDFNPPYTIEASGERSLGVAACRDCERAADGIHFLRAKRSYEAGQFTLVDGLDVVEIDCTILFQPLVDPNDNFARRTVNGRSDRRDHHGMKQPNHFRPRKYQNRPALIGP